VVSSIYSLQIPFHSFFFFFWRSKFNFGEILFRCDEKSLEDSMCKRVMFTRDETITKSLDPEAAALSRDALAKIVYSRLFDWLVEFRVIKFYCLFSCTKHIWPKTNIVLLFRIVNKINNSIGQDPDSILSIGVLDIYGFESFKTNRCLTGMLLFSSFTEVKFLQSAGWKFCSAILDFWNWMFIFLSDPT